MVKLFIDLQGSQTYGSKGRGIGRYSRDITLALAAKAEIEDLHLGWNCALETPFDIDQFGQQILNRAKKNTNLFSTPYGGVPRPKRENNIYDAYQDINDILLTHRIAQTRCRHVLMSSVMETDELDFHLPKTLNFHPFAFSYSIVYDLIPLLLKSHYLPHISFETKYMAHLRTKLSADMLFAISEQTRSDLISLLGVSPERIVTVGAGIDLKSFGGKSTEKAKFLQTFGIVHPFVLFIGGDEFRKNIDGFVAALGGLPSERKKHLQALIVGPVDKEKEATLIATARKSGLCEGSLIFAQRMSQEDLSAAYHHCAMTVIPSLYEGFGLPVLEAMACNSAVIASKNSSMSEILTASELLFDPQNPKDIASRIEFVFNNPSFVQAYKSSYRQTLKSFTWDRAANLILESFKANEMRHAKDARFQGFRAPSQHYNFILLDRPDDFLLEQMKALCADHTVHIYCDAGFFDQLALSPFSVSALETFDGDQVSGPVFVNVRTIESFEKVFDICAPQDAVLLLSARFRSLVNKRLRDLVIGREASPVLKLRAQKLSDRLGGMRSLYQVDNSTVEPLNMHNQQLKVSASSSVTDVATIAQGDFSDYIYAEMIRFEKTDPILLAKRLRPLIATLSGRRSIEKSLGLLFGEQSKLSPLTTVA